MKHSALSLFALLSFMCMYSNAQAASDWTIPANPACKVSLGHVVNTASGYRADGGTAVITCDLTKKAGSNNLNYVYARINRHLDGGSDPFCTLNSYSLYGTESDATWGFASDSAGNKSIPIPLPEIFSTGYLSVTCVLNDGDALYGIRYNQD